MHIPDNYLSPQTDAVMAVAMVPVWVHCIKGSFFDMDTS